MATSLAQQLQGIRQSANNVNFQKRKKVASLLFDPSEAADQDYDQVFAIASNGFEELVTYDSKLSKFSRTIFSDESRFLDRYTQTREQNDSLDRKLVAFVSASAPYFLLRPTQKCLEWLIRRFDIHVHLAETLILTYLPYHSSPTFSKLLAILELPQAWSFLGAVRKANEPPHISLFVKAFVKTPALLSIFLEHVQAVVLAGQSFHNLLSIYADLSVRCITTMRDNNAEEDSIYARFLPFIGEGVAMRSHTEYQVANYMVVIVLSATRTMSAVTTNAIMVATAKGLTVQSQKSGLLCLAQLCQTMDGGITPLDVDVFHAIVGNEGYMDVLLELGGKYRADRFLTAFAISAIDQATPEALVLVQKIIDTGRSSVAIVLSSIAQKVMASADLPEFRNACASFLEGLQQQTKYSKLLTTFYETLGSNVDDLELALQITLDVPSTAQIAPKMRRQSSSRPNISLEDEIAELPALPKEQNYLSVGDVRRTINVLQMAAGLDRFAEVIDSPVVGQDSDLRLSLLIRAALSSNSIETQVCAIKTLAMEVRKSISIDYQGLIPIVIALLSSKSVDVRREITQLADTLLEQSQSKGKKTVWGLNDLYGEQHTHGLKWLSTAEVQHFLDSVLASTRNECLLDHKVVYGAVARSIHTHGTKGKELSHKTAALHFLASHINHSPIQKIVLKLLLCFDKVEEATSAKTRAVLPALERWAASPKSFQAQCVLELIDPAVVERLLVRQVVPSEHGAGTKLLIDLIKQQDDVFGPTAIEWLSSGFTYLKRDTKVDLLRALIEAIIDGPSQVSRQAHASVERLSIPTDLFAQMLSAIELSPPSSRVSTPMKKQRKEVSSAPSEIDIRRFTHLLEILEKNEEKHAALLPLLFGKLGDLILIETESATSVSYTEQILLSCMYPMVDPAKFDPSTCRIDILINCIRTSSSPQVHNRALLLVAALAEAAPEQVLHGVMPIFTFMGANILRQDDGFSAHVIESTIQRVVPPLLKTLGAETESQILGAAGILRSFVDAFPHIPKHRRSKLFVVLIRTMGEDTFLAPLLAIMAEKRLQISPKSKTGESQKSYLEFALTLLRQCSIKAQLQAILGLVEIARTIPESTKDIQAADTLLNYNAVDDDHLDRLKGSILAIVGGHFASKKVRSDFEIYASDDDWAHKDLFIEIVESLLKACDNFDDSPAPLEKTLDALDRVITLLPVPLFRVVVFDLLEGKRDEYMRIKALDIVTGRATSTNPADEVARQSFFTLVKQISSIFKDQCSSALLCSALQCISTIGRKFGKSDPGAFVPVVDLVIGELGLTHDDLIVRVSAIECLTTLVVVLGPRVLPQLQRFMPMILDGFAKISRDENADLVPLATVSLLEALVKGIPSFMTPYTQSIMDRAVDFSFATEELASDKRALLSTVAKNMPTRNVLEALGGAWEKSTKVGKKPLMALITVVEETVETSERKVVTGAAKEILTLFMQALDIRRKAKAWDAKGIEQVEKRVIAALLKVVLKLNDSTFRPLFIKLRDWALSEFVDKDPVALQCRQITFFNFFSQFTLTFKSIVLNYFNYVLDDMLEILGTAGELGVVPRRLWIGLVSSLEHGFASDNEDFWRTPDKFDRVAPMLISQLDHAESYPVLLSLIPAVVELTASASSEDHFKLVNTQVLQKFRAEKPAVRLAAVTTENKLSGRMGDEWLSMLPQTIPFIAEALEDEDERVEKQTHALAITIESFLCESLDTYLR